MKISVALAYYNGGHYIKEQLESILSQLKEEDEVVLSVDKAEDGSGTLLTGWAEKDARIQLLQGPAQGVVRNFEHAISHCSGDIIFLSDQDDIWKPGKVQKVMQAFERTDYMAILHNGVIVDKNGKETGEKTLFEMRGSRAGFLKNFIRNSYIGCCMAFRKELLPLILPIPENMYMHDYWIGTAAECSGGVGLMKEPLICYRRHDENVTEMHHGGIIFMIGKRLRILQCVLILKKRVKNL
ncbi:MAG: glycosyltransferase family 2 protein [Clostridiales bacterium]|nr:glycosyltransferase family 2 protein [Clostridiales bacterium]